MNSYILCLTLIIAQGLIDDLAEVETKIIKLQKKGEQYQKKGKIIELQRKSKQYQKKLAELFCDIYKQNQQLDEA